VVATGVAHRRDGRLVRLDVTRQDQHDVPVVDRLDHVRVGDILHAGVEVSWSRSASTRLSSRSRMSTSLPRPVRSSATACPTLPNRGSRIAFSPIRIPHYSLPVISAGRHLTSALSSRDGRREPSEK